MGAINKAHPTMITGWQKVGDAGTAISLDTAANSSERIRAVVIMAMDDNSSQIVIGSSGIVASSQVRGFGAGAGLNYDSEKLIHPVNLASFYINGASSDGVDFYAIKA